MHGRRVEAACVGSGPPLAFLHGWGMSPRPYLPGLTRLAQRAQRRIVALSLPGFGGTDPLPVGSQGISGMAAHLSAAIEALIPNEPVDLVGHSLGGGVALRIAATRPDLVRTLTLFCPVGGAGLGPAPLHRLVGGVTLEGVHRWTPQALVDLIPALHRHPVAALTAAVAGWRADLLQDVVQLGHQRTRTVLCFAQHDTVVVPGAMPQITFPHLRCEIVPGRHSWMLTEPDRFVDTMLRHLGNGVPAAA